MNVYSQLKSAQLENKSATPATQGDGFVYFDTVNKKPLIDDNTDVSALLMEKHLESTLSTQDLLGKVAAIDTYANLVALARVQGLVYLASDRNIIYFDDGTELRELGAGGGGSVNTFFIEKFEENDNTFFTTENGSWTKEDETVEPLRGTRSVKFTQVAGSLGAKQVSESIELERDQKGSECGHFFRYRTADDNYYEVTIEESDDGVTFTKILNSRELNLLAGKQGGVVHYIPKGSSTHVRMVFEVLVESAGHELVVDSIEAKTNPLQTIEFDYTRDSVEYSPAVDIVGTVTSSQAFYYKVANKAKFTGQVIIGSTASGNLNISLPDNLLFDTSNLPTTNSSFGKLGEARWYNASAPSNGQKLWVCYNGDDKFFFKEEDGTPFDGTFLDNGDSIYYDFEAPIQGWSSNGKGVVTSGQSLDTVTFSAQRTTSQSLPNGVNTVIQYNNILNDSHNGWDGTSQYIVPEDGDYQIQVFAEYSPSSSGVRQTNINGVATSFVGNPSASSGTIIDGQRLITGLSEGDAISVDQFQNSGTTLNAGNSGGVYNRIEIFKVTPSTRATVISPFKTEIATGQEYKTGEVLNGKDVYEYVHEVTSEISTTSTIVSNPVGIVNPVGHINYAGSAWEIRNVQIGSDGATIWYDKSNGNINALILGNHRIKQGVLFTFKYTK